MFFTQRMFETNFYVNCNAYIHTGASLVTDQARRPSDTSMLLLIKQWQVQPRDRGQL